MAGHKKQCPRSRTAERQGPERTQDAGPPEVVPKRAGVGHQFHIHSAFCPPKGRVCVCASVCWPSVLALCACVLMHETVKPVRVTKKKKRTHPDDAFHAHLHCGPGKVAPTEVLVSSQCRHAKKCVCMAAFHMQICWESIHFFLLFWLIYIFMLA